MTMLWSYAQLEIGVDTIYRQGDECSLAFASDTIDMIDRCMAPHHTPDGAVCRHLLVFLLSLLSPACSTIAGFEAYPI